jgi:hypothetical protein
MSKRLEFMWEHVFPKPDGSADRRKFVKVEDEAKKSIDGSENYGAEEEQALNSKPHHLAWQNPSTHMWDYQPLPQFEHPHFTGRQAAHDYRVDDIRKRVRVIMSDFHGKLDPYTFQDWFTALEYYFDWFGLSPYCKVRFVKMKLKGQARVWWHSVEEYLHRLRLAPISEMKLKL